MKFNFNSNSYTFKPRPFPLFAFIVALSILLGLSGWQIKRLNWKTDLISQRINSFESDPISFINLNQPEKNEFRKVFVDGQLLNEFEMYMPALSKRGNNGFHVIVGSIFLLVCYFRGLKGHFTPKKHLGFEFAAWYWHFVDVVWLFLFTFVYWWAAA